MLARALQPDQNLIGPDHASSPGPGPAARCCPLLPRSACSDSPAVNNTRVRFTRSWDRAVSWGRGSWCSSSRKHGDQHGEFICSWFPCSPLNSSIINKAGSESFWSRTTSRSVCFPAAAHSDGDTRTRSGPGQDQVRTQSVQGSLYSTVLMTCVSGWI